MKHIQVLDCTLRDGGYANECRFGINNIKKIIKGLVEANVDVIECGFLTEKVIYNADVTKFPELKKISDVIPDNREGKLFVALMNYGEYNTDCLPDYDGKSIDGIRLAFHKKDKKSAIEVCRKIKEKGYKVFVQPMVSLSYSDEEFLELIREVNNLGPYAFYIVDSFGTMKRKELIRMFYMVEHNLDANIFIGFHSHNNMQLAYSNAQSLVDIHTDRKLIIDSSIYGMGRGAGNLNTELFVEYLNENAEGKYQLTPLLTIIDEILNSFYQKNYWGYSLPNYLSAKHNVHPNYAGYLDSKKTLTVENINDLFSMMDEEKKNSYDKDYIEELYIKYMETGKAHEEHCSELQAKLSGKEVLIIAPGRSSLDEKEKVIVAAKRENVVTISVNYDYPEYETDFIFLSNLRRYRELENDKYYKCIITSNIPSVDAYLQMEYRELLNMHETVKDNAGLMLIKLLIQLGVKKVLIAGLDGYSLDPTQNYADQRMSFYTKRAIFEAMNEGLNSVLNEYSKQITIQFITTPRYIMV